MSDEGSTGGDIFQVPRGRRRGAQSDARAWRLRRAIWRGPSSRSSSTSPSTSTAAAPSRRWIPPTRQDRTPVAGRREHQPAVRGQRHLHSRTMAARRRVIRSSWKQPPEVWAGADRRSGAPDHARESPAQGRCGARPRACTGRATASAVQGWLLYPASFDRERKYPMVVAVHGGPASVDEARPGRGPASIRRCFRSRATSSCCPIRAAATGRARSSPWPTSRISAAAICATSWPAWTRPSRPRRSMPQRVGITGWSYGGYMTMWAVTQTNRFRAAVAGRRHRQLAELLRRERHRPVDDSVLRRVGL